MSSEPNFKDLETDITNLLEKQMKCRDSWNHRFITWRYAFSEPI